MKKSVVLLILLVICFIPVSIADQARTKAYVQNGEASYYADKFHNRKTANGEKYNKFAITAAHRRIPFNSLVEVKNLDNGKSLMVRINDRGPFIKGRIIDVSRTAAELLGMIRNGKAKVQIRMVKEAGKLPVSVAMPDDPTQSDPEEKTVKNTGNTTKKSTTKTKKKKKGFFKRIFSRDPEEDLQVSQERIRKLPMEKRFEETGTYSIWGMPKQPKGWSVQVASYAGVSYAQEVGERIHAMGFKDVFMQSGWHKGRRLYRVVVGEGSKETVELVHDQLRKKGVRGFIKHHL